MPTLVSTGQITISDVHDGLHARLSNESVTITTDSNGEYGDYSGCSTTMSVLVGTSNDTAEWSFSASATTGVVGSLVGNTYTVTNLTEDAGYVDITATRVGYATLTSRFSLAKSKQGNSGAVLSIVSSGSGFSFRDGIAEPATQSISFTAIRQNITGPVEFYASNGVQLTLDTGALALSNYSTGTFGTGVGDTCYIDLAAFGDNQQVTITAVADGVSATATVVRLDSSTAAAGATVGATWGVDVNNQPSFTDFLDSFEGDASLWHNHLGSGEISVVSITDGQSGGKALRVGNNSGNDQAWLIHKNNIPFDPNATYRIKFRARQISGTGQAYFGVAGVAANGTSLVNKVGNNDHGSQHYLAASGVTVPGTWTEYVGYLKGTAATGIDSSRNQITNPGQIHQNAKYIRPLILVNYPGVAGQVEIDYARIELLTDSVNWDTVTGAGKDALITTANNASTAAATANSAIADIASDDKLTASEKSSIKLEWDILVAEKSGINAQATAFGITTENTTYNTKYDTLSGYLSPLLANLTTTSTIVGSILRSNFSDLYSARQTLLNKIAEVASTRSNWTSVSGKPTDEQIMNVLVPQGVYNKVALPYSGRSLYIPCYVDNSQAASGWFKIAEMKLHTGYNACSFVGNVCWGQTSKRFTNKADVKINFVVGNPATTMTSAIFNYSGDKCADVLKVRRSQDGNGIWIVGVYAYLPAWGGLLLDGNWYVANAADSWIDDYQGQGDVIAGDPGLTDVTAVADYELGATRNVYRGDWANSTAYALGDGVIHDGYGWSCITAHTSVNGTNNPPTYPTTSNTWWTLASIKGEDAKGVYLTSSSYIFKVAQDGSISPSSIAITAVAQNQDGNPDFTITSGTATLSGSGNARTISASSMTTDSITVKGVWGGYEDYVTILKVREGASGLTVAMSNESHVMPAAEDGTVAIYEGSGTTFQVYEGSSALWASSTATTSAFRLGTITQNPSASLTVGAISYLGNTVTIANHSAISSSVESVVLTIPITIYRADGSSTTVTKTQTIAKSKQGITGADGANAKLAVLSSTSTVFQVSKTGVASPSSITLTAYGQNVTGNPTFSVTSGTVTLTGTGASRDLAYSNMSTDTATIKIDWDGRTDYLTIVKVREGADGSIGVDGKSAITVVVANEAHTVPASTGGAVSSYVNSGTTVEVYEGTTKLTAGGSSNGSFTIGTPTQTPASTITVGTISYAGTTATVAAHSGMSNSTDSVAITYPVVVKRADGSTSTINQVQTITKSKAGVDGATGSDGQNAITAILSNEAHAFPANTDGTVSSYTGSGTKITVYEGATALNYFPYPLPVENGGWTVSTSASNISVGSISNSGTYITVGNHFGVAAGTDTSTITYTISGKTTGGVSFSFTKQQSFTKSKTGSTGEAGAQGPAISLVTTKAATFTSTDGVLDGGQVDIGFTAYTYGISSPSYVWTFSGLENSPATANQSWMYITPAHFGNSKSATVTCTVNGTYTDKITIVRLEKSTAAAGATVGANSSNLQSGRGINLLYNAGMTLSLDGFNYYGGTVGRNLSGWCIRDTGSRYGTVYIQAGAETAGGAFYIHDNRVPVVAGRRYEAYIYTGAHRCNCNITIDYWDGSGNALGTGSGISYVNGGANNEEAMGGTALVGYKQIGVFSTAPTGAATARFVLWKGGTKGGQTSSYLFATMPYIGEATAGQTELSPWAEGSSAINTQITSANASTYIANAAIGSAQIGSINLVGTSNFAVKSATSGARMDMDSRRIKIFDASGVLRVQIGDLSV